MAALRKARLLKELVRASQRLQTSQRGCGANSRNLCSSSPLCSDWQLYSAVCLERLPRLTQEKTPIEQTFSGLLHDLENEYSVLSDHELRHREDLKLAEGRKKDEDDDDDTEISGEVIRQTALETEDQWETELHAFKAASRTTEADLKQDVKSADRKLDRKLTLLVKQKLPDPKCWVLPQEKRVDGESMRQAAERALQNATNGNVEALFLGNAPVGFYKYKYPKELRKDGTVGAKIFFFKAQLKDGEIPSDSDLMDHAWVTKEELKEYLIPNYNDSVQKFILEL